MFSSLLSFGALALATSGHVQSILHHNSLTTLEDSKCSPVQVTLHVPSSSSSNATASDEGEGEDEENFYHINGLIRRSSEKPATLWTLERDPNYEEGWKIFWTHPNGNKQYWYSSGDEIRIGSFYSATTVYLRYVEEDEAKKADDEEESKDTELVMYWNERCLNYGTEDDGKVWMTDGSLCENVVLRNVTELPVFKPWPKDC